MREDREHVPMKLGYLAGAPGSKISCFTLKVDNKPGLLASVAAAFSDGGANIIWVHSDVLGPEEVGVTICADFSRAKEGPGEIEGKLAGIPGVKEVRRLKITLEDFLLGEVHFPLLFGKERAVVIRTGIAKRLYPSMERMLGSGWYSLLYHVGFSCGRAILEEMKEMSGREDPSLLLDLCIRSMKASGLCLVSFPDLDLEAGRALAWVDRSAECELAKELGKDVPSSHFIRGMIAGLISSLSGREVRCVEVRCIAKGDERCEVRCEPFKRS